MSTMRQSDLIIVGAGIMGLAHAYHAARKGMSVTVIERDPEASGASIRNFGMLATIAQAPGINMERGRRSQVIWQELAAETGFSLRKTGCLIVAASDVEMTVLQSFVSTAERDGHTATMVPRKQLQDYVPSLRTDTAKGGLWAPDVWKIDQRTAMKSLAAWLHKAHGVTFHFGVNVEAVTVPDVTTSNGGFSANCVIVCAGSEFHTLFPDAFAATGIRTCQLQMLRTAPRPAPASCLPFILGGLSIARYEAFAACDGMGDLQAQLEQDYPDHIANGIHVIACAEDDGTITIGDSHTYSADSLPGRSPEIDNLILGYLEERLALPNCTIAERWLGHYASLPGTDVLRLNPSGGVELVTMTNGQGITHGPAIAEETIAALG
ncbi:MAG: TIGR03364 family FAD-dependent oxidoreductase [Hyphomicrobiaceae bacterium]